MAEITWKIETSLTNDNYVTIKNNGGTSSIGYLSTPSNTTEGASLITSSVVNNNSTWELCLYTGDPIDGVGRYNFESNLIPGETYTHQAYMYSSTVGRNGPVSYSSGDENVLTVDTSSGLVAAVAPGRANIWLTYPGSPLRWGRTVTVSSSTLIECYGKNGFLDVANSAFSGEYIECNEKNQSTRSVWTFEYQGNGYYAIKNDITGYYITETSGYAKQLIKGSSFTNSQLWKVMKQSDGTYKIESKAKPGYYITEENVSHSSEDPDILVSNSSAENKQKWHISPLTMNLNIYYDQAFVDMYSAINVSVDDFLYNVYTNKRTDLTNYRTISEAFLEEFGVHINLNIVGLYSTNPYIHNCDLRNNGGAICFGSPNCAVNSTTITSDVCLNTHHKNSVKLRDSTPESSKTIWTAINVLYTGHRPCYVSSGSHITSGLLGVGGKIADEYTRCVVYLQNFSNPTNYEHIHKTTAHEILHILGATHHYDETHNAAIDNCIHGFNSNNKELSGGYTLYNLTMCQNCKNKMTSIKYKLYLHNN